MTLIAFLNTNSSAITAISMVVIAFFTIATFFHSYFVAKGTNKIAKKIKIALYMVAMKANPEVLDRVYTEFKEKINKCSQL